jgi:xanthine dehydrogenase accessory factor
MTCFSGGTLEIYIEPHYPQPRLLVVGNLPVARALVALGKVMSYEIVAVDPDGDPKSDALAGAYQLLSNLTELPSYVHRETYAVVATHGSADEAALEQLLKARPRYIGLVASRKRFESVVEYLRLQGFAAADLERIKAPAGLDIQAQQGDEIALSILAEIVQFRRNAQQAADWSALPSAETAEDKPAPEPVAGIAIDPVCHMEVEIATAQYSYEHEDKTYYFCGPGCQVAFRKNPHEYLEAEHTHAG